MILLALALLIDQPASTLPGARWRTSINVVGGTVRQVRNTVGALPK